MPVQRVLEIGLVHRCPDEGVEALDAAELGQVGRLQVPARRLHGQREEELAEGQWHWCQSSVTKGERASVLS